MSLLFFPPKNILQKLTERAKDGEFTQSNVAEENLDEFVDADCKAQDLVMDFVKSVSVLSQFNSKIGDLIRLQNYSQGLFESLATKITLNNTDFEMISTPRTMLTKKK